MSRLGSLCAQKIGILETPIFCPKAKIGRGKACLAPTGNVIARSEGTWRSSMLPFACRERFAMINNEYLSSEGEPYRSSNLWFIFNRVRIHEGLSLSVYHPPVSCLSR